MIKAETLWVRNKKMLKFLKCAFQTFNDLDYFNFVEGIKSDGGESFIKKVVVFVNY